MKATIPSLEIEVTAYFAGLFDGEGYISVNVKDGERGGTGVLYVGVGSTDFPVLEDLRRTFGGCLTKMRISSRSSKRLSREWKITNGGAVAFLKAVYPYLRIKKRQAALAFKFRKMMDQNFRTHDAHRTGLFKELAAEIRSVNRGQSPGVETIKEASL